MWNVTFENSLLLFSMFCVFLMVGVFTLIAIGGENDE